MAEKNFLEETVIRKRAVSQLKNEKFKEKSHRQTEIKTTSNKNGIRNCALIFFAIFLIRELIYEFKWLNILNLPRLLKIDRSVFIFAIIIILRNFSVYFFRNYYFLFFTEITFYYLIYNYFKSVIAVNLTMLSISSFMKCYSFLKEVSQYIPKESENNSMMSKKFSEKINHSRENDTLLDRTLISQMDGVSEKINHSCENDTLLDRTLISQMDGVSDSIFPQSFCLTHDNSKIYDITFTFYVRYLFSPSLIFSNKYERYHPVDSGYFKIFGEVLKSISIWIITFTFYNLFICFYFFPCLVYYKPEFSLFGLLQYCKVVYCTFIFWILSFLYLFYGILQTCACITNIKVVLFSDWWNSNNFKEFWSNWNIQVHLFLKRYVLIYFLKNIYSSKILASFTTFLVSAMVHELISFLFCKRILYISFLSIFSQYLMISFESYIYMNNCIFWILFCVLGQPITMIAMGADFYRAF
ncbi:Sterol O-acyltransferase/Diacylglycerol O-acyltransferase [Pseudoloma neurophilia]|uniref:O-acyltransferase n=1 Tax=Pseudoloma neurophilia TaxID=146866 RepID=A0A0R0LTI1_9MICR|nr:Sterol O-acyltransferase/Diacylglycerol O-acyltransferase [Pseudoloma neurophilia]